MSLRTLLDQKPQFGVFFSFCIYSFSFGALFPRIGDMQLQMGITQSTLGLSIIGIALGLQVSLFFAGMLFDQLGFRLVMLAGIPVISLTEVIAATATGPLFFFATLFFTGLALGIIEVAVNVEADRVEEKIGKRIMNRSHAFWSFGFFMAGLLGALIAQWGLSAYHHLLGFLALTTLINALVFTRYQPAGKRSSDTKEDDHIRFAKPTLPILGLVALSVSAMLLEGAGIDWSVIFMRDVFATQPIISGLALTLFALSQFAVRFVADHYVEQSGPDVITKISLFVLLAGVLAITFSPMAIVALLGFAMLGAGSAVVFPLAISAAAQLQDRPSAVNVASFAQLSFVVFLLAPPILGTVAEYFGIRTSFAISLPLIAVSFLFIGALRIAPEKQS